MRTSALRAEARSLGIEPSYLDATGKRQLASKAALAAAIEARSRTHTSEERIAEPVMVVWGSARARIELREPQTVEWDLALEDGGWRSGRASGSFTLELLPFGYHTLRMRTADGRTHEMLLIAAPMKAHAPRSRAWGVFAPLYAAHSGRSWGAGDLGDLLEYASWLDHYGGSVVATLPMLAAFDDEPSPYSPVSRLFWNEMYLDATRLPEFRAEDVDEGVLAHLRQTPRVEYQAVRHEKRRVLERCFQRFIPDQQFATFANGEASEYARWRAAYEQERGSASEHAGAFHLYVQYRMAQQMREVANAARRLGSGLYLDFPLGVNANGYDVARYGHVFAKNVSAGAPPDVFFTKGQDWGFPPFDPDALREDRYDYFRKAIRHHVSHAGTLRIDHVMGLHRLYWIPEGLDARDGVYVRYRAEELYAILTLESRRHGCTIVGEDLGTVPPEVPRMMVRHGLRRMYVVQYEIKPQDPPLSPPPAASVASVNTHDMPTFAAWWNGRDIDDRVAQGLLDARGAEEERRTRDSLRRAVGAQEGQTAYESLLGFLASSDAEIVLVSLEDLWQELEPQNVPGVPERSWRHKFRMGLEAARADGSIRRLFAQIQAQRAHDLLSIRGPGNEVSKDG